MSYWLLILVPFLFLSLACDDDDDSRSPAGPGIPQRGDGDGQPGGGQPSGGWCQGAGTASAEVATCHKGDVQICAVEAAVVKYTNALRSKPLAASGRMSYSAREWSKAQAADGSISHAGFPGERERVLQAEFGADQPSCPAGENVAMAMDSRLAKKLKDDPDAVGKQFVDMWESSSGHRENMLSTDWDTIGVGFAASGSSVYGTQIFGWE